MRDAIDSALNQTYPEIEVLVINDGSSDDGKTEEIALSYGDRIRYFKKENGGVSSALNVGIKNMRGAYFSWLSHDDVYTPDKVETEMRVMTEYPDEKCVVLCQSTRVDPDLNPALHIKQKRDFGYYSWERAVMYITKYGANGCALLIPREAFAEAGLFDESLRYCQDILMWWKIFLEHYALIVISDACVLSRVHPQQTTHTRAELYHHDASYIGGIIPQRLIDMSTKENNCIYVYAKGEALHGNKDVYHRCITLSKGSGLLTLKHRFVICTIGAYGTVRPRIRSLYRRMITR